MGRVGVGEGGRVGREVRKGRKAWGKGGKEGGSSAVCIV